MALSPKRGDLATATARGAESARRLRTRRPLRGAVPTCAVSMEGPITPERFILPVPIRIDPNDEGDFVEYKRIIAFDGWISAGVVNITWNSETAGVVLADHEISGPDNMFFLDDPFIIEHDPGGRELILPTIDSVFSDPEHLALWIWCETVPR